MGKRETIDRQLKSLDDGTIKDRQIRCRWKSTMADVNDDVEDCDDVNVDYDDDNKRRDDDDND